ncbi:hypothetical protein BB558_001272 [Smittium angustum]|uniref:Glutamate-rich WD repeat-containing protein 1 n=1 Tax=Smittium angustum TaxID=133377 RepID=A0A2U1JC38_SMIAN|nr:hypothetical protein BB558_001272 [Smittium angustum]
MSKRANDQDIEMDVDSIPNNPKTEEQVKSRKVSFGGVKPISNEEVEMGEFEDIWEDEIESEEYIEEDDDDEDDLENYDEEKIKKDIEMDEEQENIEEKIYLPGDELAEGEVLEPDTSVYQMLHTLNVNWPCLSFDILKDELGDKRGKFPHTLTLFTGTQASEVHKNEVTLMKLSQLHKTSTDDDENDESDDENDVDEDPILETRSMKHRGGVNRVRVTQTRDNILGATWSDEGTVYIWNLKDQMKSLETPGYKATTKNPIHKIQNHTFEGFALDWQESNRLLSGDCEKYIYLSTIRDNGSINTENSAFTGHKSSVEDLQWSPEESFVFASCSSDKSIRIWDIRQKQRTNALCVPNAHKSDVNVISWNKNTRYLLASGDDDGLFSIWDLRSWKPKSNSTIPVATMEWHKNPITSIEWHPTDESVLAVSGADDQLTIWDLSVELDSEEQKVQTNAFVGPNGEQRAVPPQLLFIHQGQNDIKELHWHPQIPGTIVSTALSGFNIIKTISV